MQKFSDFFGRSFKRNIGQARDGGNDGDVGPLVVECKRRKSLKTLSSWYAQAKAAATRRKEGRTLLPVPIVVMREDNGQSMVLLSLDSFLVLAEESIAADLPPEEPAVEGADALKDHGYQFASEKPNPGSDAALRAGCTCPVLDNAHGKGSGWGPDTFWVNAACPLHGNPAAHHSPQADGTP